MSKISNLEEFTSVLKAYSQSFTKAPKGKRGSNATAFKQALFNVMGPLERSLANQLPATAYDFLASVKFGKGLFGHDDRPEKLIEYLRTVLSTDLTSAEKRALYNSLKDAASAMRQAD